jgi:rhodanese-related sulfurtransferase
MPWIENIPLENVAKGQHHACGENSMLIQISDHDMAFPSPKHTFKQVHQFIFLDIEEESDFAITDAQAAELVRLLQHAFENRMNVVVHCHAGICRSGAVCEVGVMMGFSDCERFRVPNLLVKHKMMRVLGWTYDEQEKSYDVNGTVNEWGFIMPKHEGDI